MDISFDRPDRPAGVIGKPMQTRGLPENPAQGVRRPVGASIPPPPPIPSSRSKSSISSTSSVVSAAQVISMVQDAMDKAIKENEAQAAEASGVSNDLKPGVTIDLGRKKIQALPDEVVDIIKNELERLALSHNFLSSFPARFSECTSLRYLNVRGNRITEFPLSLCDLKALEILDLGRNELTSLPPDIAKLTSLKVLALQRNKIKVLPLTLGDMTSLQVLKLNDNPIEFPPPDVMLVQASSPPNEGYLKESEVTEVVVTAHIKKYLKQRSIANQASTNGRAESDAGGDESSEGTETPRVPLKRVVSGRFPIKVNVNDGADLRSPAIAGRPPPIPSRSHYRGLSQQSTAVRRPSVMPLTIGSALNERVRSNSETLLRASRVDRLGDRSRRMGIVSRQPSELGTLDETQANNRFSHYRGLSHGSAMQGNGVNVVKSPASPADAYSQRPIYVRRLSILPERRRESKILDPVLEAAKGILYSIFQIHPVIQMMMGLASDDSAKRSSLEIVFYNTSVHVEELEQEIQKHDFFAEEDEPGALENENVQRACVTLVSAYAHVCSLLMNSIDTFVDNGDPRYIRTMLMLLYNSIMELRVTANCLGPNDGNGYKRSASRATGRSIGDTIRPHSRESSVTPTVDRPGMAPRGRYGAFVHNPSSLRVSTDVPMAMPYINGTGRTATITSATPRSGESFASSNGTSAMNGDFSEEDRKFENIFLLLQRSSDLVMRTLPGFNNQFQMGLRKAMTLRANEPIIQLWKGLIAQCTATISQTEVLKNRLSSIKFKEPGIRTQPTFWGLCRNFIQSWADFIPKIQDCLNSGLQLPVDIRVRLRPLQQSIKETSIAIDGSPWTQLGTSATMMSPYSARPSPLPMTPQSAALGPAVQATVPSTPQSASFAAAFTGNVFERADALISMGGLSMSRSGTMTTNSSLNSLNSTLSSNNEIMTPSTVVSPGPLGPLPLRLNNGSKVAF